jgi:carboxylesterase type B
MSWNKFLPLITVICFVNAWTNSADVDPPIASIDCGQLRGKEITTSRGKCDAYLGVPFAAPPIGDLRFEKPQSPTCWEDTRDATDFGPICVQDGSNGTDPKTESEDCLYLNVFVPKRKDSHAKYPVMVFIHGGRFTFGSAKEFGVDGICENLASRGVIIVTIQYRLFLYGFLSTGSKAAFGNYGIWDQIASLEWVKRNIAQFGGDPDQVTIFGESAGGASISLITYTPVAKDLFHQSIAESGSAFAPWAMLSDESVSETMRLPQAANCANPDQELLVKCLRQLSMPTLQKIYNAHKPPSNFTMATPWPTRVDGELFKQAALQELKTGKPAIIGVNSLEIAPQEQCIPQADSILNSILDGAFPGKSIQSNVLKQTTLYAFVNATGDSTNTTFLCQQFSQLLSDTGFRAPAALETYSKMLAGSPVWVYKFDHYSKNVFPSGYPFEKGAPHAHELCYLFLKPLQPGRKEGMLTCPSKYEGDDRIVADQMGEMWTNFAIKGNPSSSSLEWPQFHNVTHANTMHIRTTLDILPDFYVDIANFWNFLVPNIEQAFKSSQAESSEKSS